MLVKMEAHQRTYALVCLVNLCSNLNLGIIPVGLGEIENYFSFKDIVTLSFFVYMLSVSFGALIVTSSYVTMSRKKLVLISIVMMCVGHVLGFFSGYWRMSVLLVLGRCVFGVSTGVLTCVSLLLLTDIHEGDPNKSSNHGGVIQTCALVSTGVSNVASFLMIIQFQQPWYTVYALMFVVSLPVCFLCLYQFGWKKLTSSDTPSDMVDMQDMEEQDVTIEEEGFSITEEDNDELEERLQQITERDRQKTSAISIFKEALDVMPYRCYIISSVFMCAFLNTLLFLGPQILEETVTFMKPDHLLVIIAISSLFIGVLMNQGRPYLLDNPRITCFNVPQDYRAIHNGRSRDPGEIEISEIPVISVVCEDYNIPVILRNFRNVNAVLLISGIFCVSAAVLPFSTSNGCIFLPFFFLMMSCLMMIAAPYSELSIDLFPQSTRKTYGATANLKCNGYMIALSHVCGDIPAVCLANTVRHHLGAEFSMGVLVLSLVMFFIWLVGIRYSFSTFRFRCPPRWKIFSKVSLLAIPTLLAVFLVCLWSEESISFIFSHIMSGGDDSEPITIMHFPRSPIYFVR